MLKVTASPNHIYGEGTRLECHGAPVFHVPNGSAQAAASSLQLNLSSTPTPLRFNRSHLPNVDPNLKSPNSSGIHSTTCNSTLDTLIGLRPSSPINCHDFRRSETQSRTKRDSAPKSHVRVLSQRPVSRPCHRPRTA